MGPTLQEYQWRVINTMIGGTTLRNQGAPGVAEAARAFLADVALERFVTKREEDFQLELDEQTKKLRLALPIGAQNWGTARKALNLVLAEAQYHRHLCAAYGLSNSARKCASSCGRAARS